MGLTLNRFVVKAHWATRLHYDLRLEIDGVAKSWAIPKEPIIKPGERRLAVLVGDHSIEDMNHEDTNKDKTVGSGRVETWDQGTYEIREKGVERFVLWFNGQKLKGIYGLFRVKAWKGNNWLIIKAMEEL